MFDKRGIVVTKHGDISRTLQSMAAQSRENPYRHRVVLGENCRGDVSRCLAEQLLGEFSASEWVWIGCLGAEPNNLEPLLGRATRKPDRSINEWLHLLRPRNLGHSAMPQFREMQRSQISARHVVGGHRGNLTSDEGPHDEYDRHTCASRRFKDLGVTLAGSTNNQCVDTTFTQSVDRDAEARVIVLCLSDLRQKPSLLKLHGDATQDGGKDWITEVRDNDPHRRRSTSAEAASYRIGTVAKLFGDGLDTGPRLASNK